MKPGTEYRSQPLRESVRFPRRMALCAAAAVVAVMVLVSRIGYLTTVRGGEYSEAAQRNLQSLRRVEAPRGTIFDRSGVPLAVNRKAYSVTFARHGLSAVRIQEVHQRLGELLDIELTMNADEIIESRPSWARHRLARQLPQEAVISILERPDDFPGVRVEEDSIREYPFGPALATVVGFMGRLQAGEEERFTRPIYLPDAMVGRMGVERAFEADLVGKPGLERLTRDARGRYLMDPRTERPAAAGDDLVLTLDGPATAAAYHFLGDRHGSIVAVDVWTGGVVVLATSPTYDPAAPGRQELNGAPVSFLNRGFQGAYPPGSTHKIVTAAAGMQRGLDSHARVHCSGNHRAVGWLRPFWCDNRSGHGPADLFQSIQWSCNVYYYKLGEDLGLAALEQEARRWGFGSASGFDLLGERAGGLPSTAGVANPGETLNVSIGQGALLATPLQVAMAYAALANGGDVLQPTIVHQRVLAGAGTPVRSEPVVRRRLGLTPAQRADLIEGLYRVVHRPGGTAVRVGFEPAWEVCGKTGTAENASGGVDAWFACFYPRANPRYAIVAHVEDAEGHGGEIAGPMVRELIRVLEHGGNTEANPMVTAQARLDM